MAVCFERQAYEAADAHTAAMALTSKSQCLAEAGMYREAAQTMDRIAVFSLDPGERTDFLMRKAVYYAFAGRFDEAEAVADELELLQSECTDPAVGALFKRTMDMLRSGRPQHKTAEKAFARTFLPPLAHIYAGRTGEGILRAAGDAAAVTLGILEAVAGNWVTAFLAGGTGLYESFWKGNAGLYDDIDRLNAEADEAFRKQLLHENTNN